MENENKSVAPDKEWANDVPFKTLEKDIEQKKEASLDAFKSLEESVKSSASDVSVEARAESKPDKTDSKSKKVKNQKNQKKQAKKGRKAFTICLFTYLIVLSAIMGVFLYKFYYFLDDYEKVYNESLPYHTMDDFMTAFDSFDIDTIVADISEKPVISEFESDENLKNYVSYLLDGKEIDYYEANDSTDRSPKYNITADGYIVGSVSLSQASEKRAHDLPIYELSNFEFYTDPSYCALVKIPDTCTAYVNGVKVGPEYIFRIDTDDEDANFKDLEHIPLIKYYMVDDLYEKPSVSVINSFGMEFEPTLDTTTGIYAADYKVPEEIENEMLDFAKSSIDTYARVMSRELGAYALDAIFTKNHPWVSAIKNNESQFEWFPNHSTTGTDDTIREFIPYSENAFCIEIEHVQHTLKYGVYPTDIPLLARAYYVKEDGNWKICTINFIYD